MDIGRFDWERLIDWAKLPKHLKAVAYVLAHRAAEDGSDVCPGVTLVADILDNSEKTTGACINQLVAFGWLRLVRKGGGAGREGNANVYQLTCPAQDRDGNDAAAALEAIRNTPCALCGHLSKEHTAGAGLSCAACPCAWFEQLPREPERVPAMQYHFQLHPGAFAATRAIGVSLDEFGFFVACAVASAEACRPGVVRPADMNRLAPEDRRDVLVARLVALGLVREHEGAYEMASSVLWAFRPQRYRQPIPEELQRAVYERDGNRCGRCGAIDDLTLDHIRPWSLGGPDTFENLQTLCRRCNSSKGATL